MGAICSNLPGVPSVPELKVDKAALMGPLKTATQGLAPQREAEEAKLRQDAEWKDKPAEDIKKEAARRLIDSPDIKKLVDECVEQCWGLVEPTLDEQLEEAGASDLPDAIVDKAKDKLKSGTVEKMVKSAFVKAAMGGPIDADGDGNPDEDGADDKDGDGVADALQ